MDKLTEKLTCSMCLDIYDHGHQRPKSLPCLHTFCRQCLCLFLDQHLEDEIPCPQCRAIFTRPDNGVDGLLTNFMLNDLIDALPAKSDKDVDVCSFDKRSKMDPVPCKLHPGNPCSFMCVTCCIGLCNSCIPSLGQGKHAHHEIQQMSEYVAKTNGIKKELNEKFNRINEAIHPCVTMFRQGVTRRAELVLIEVEKWKQNMNNFAEVIEGRIDPRTDKLVEGLTLQQLTQCDQKIEQFMKTLHNRAPAIDDIERLGSIMVERTKAIHDIQIEFFGVEPKQINLTQRPSSESQLQGMVLRDIIPNLAQRLQGTYHHSSLNYEGSSSSGEDCVICQDTITRPKTLPCKHVFCTECIDQAFKISKPACPVCGALCGTLTGTQPYGTMKTRTDYRKPLPGYPGCAVIVINYHILNGTQTEEHPSPGKPFKGLRCTAYLPDNPEGQKVLWLLQRAFDAKLTFTVECSVTTGQDGRVMWGDIHHKTSITGGPERFGYPDPGYLKRVQEELAAKGITED